MTTDQMILALVQRHGFKLPDGLAYDSGGLPDRNDLYFRPTRPSWSRSPSERVDLCAMEFARQAEARGRAMFNLLRSQNPIATDEAECQFDKANRRGDSAAAIKALYDAMEAK